MSTIQDLLTDINDRFSNYFTDAQKVRWMNEAQREIFRELAIMEIYQFNTLKGISTYNLPSDIDFELIQTITIDNVQYYPKNLKDSVGNAIFYKILDGVIGIYPEPNKDDLVANVFYQRRPSALSSDNLSQVLELREDYSHILKYKVMAVIAEATDDIAKYNNFITQYNQLLKQIKQEKYEQMSKYPSTQDVMKKSRNYGRRKVSEVVNLVDV